MPTATLRTDSSQPASWDLPMMTLWRVVMVGPGGQPLTVELRAPTQAIALDRAAFYKPYHRIAEDQYGNPLVERRPTRC